MQTKTTPPTLSSQDLSTVVGGMRMSGQRQSDNVIDLRGNCAGPAGCGMPPGKNGRK